MLAYQQGGNEEGRKVVFLHGLLGSGQDWQGVTSRLTDCHWLCLDLPGHGDSVDCPSVDFATTVDAVRQICDQVWGNQSAYVVGYSLGARIAMHLATAYPARWQGVLLEAGHPASCMLMNVTNGWSMIKPGPSALRMNRSLPY
ncbi:alpha/beta fold hydrolase [Salinivibrio socompensis]|uniref:alpha/beta fold hydrolase n=1 Tax=Salinivibrio socompensis TaxID=1510206 RepID=UPI0004BB66CD|nr:alpha/beta fold hydrolase [Salinivibrio socompensis]